MRKIILCILFLMLFSGCSEKDMQQMMAQTIANIEEAPVTQLTNMKRTYFDYYLPRHIGKRSQELENATFLRGTQTFYMNLDVAGIVVDTYYNSDEAYKQSIFEDATVLQNQVFHKTGSLSNYAKYERPYEISIHGIDGQYLVLMQYDQVRFSALLPYTEISETLYDMFMIARSVRLDNQAILNEYSNKEIFVIKNKLDLFEQVFPENGVLYDVLHPEISDNPSHEELDIPKKEDDGITPDEDMSHEADLSQ